MVLPGDEEVTGTGKETVEDADADVWHASVAERLKEAYIAVDRESFVPSPHDPTPHIPCASTLLGEFPALRDLFTVTLTLDVLLKRREVDALLAIRMKRLQWYKVVFARLHGAYDICGLLRYWVKGIIVYEFREIDRYIGCDVDSMQRKQENVLRAIEHAVELHNALRRFPRLVTFLFAGKLRLKDTQMVDDLVKEVILDSLDTGVRLRVLQRLLMDTLQYRRGWQCSVGMPPHIGSVDSLWKQRIRGSPLGICELIRLVSQDARLTEDHLVTTILRSVVEGCQKFFHREQLLRLLDTDSCESDARRTFLLKTWPQYWHNELNAMQDLPCVEEAWVKGILVKLVFLWDIRNDSSGSVSISDSSDTFSELHSCYIFQLLSTVLKPLFDDIFDIDAHDEDSVPSTQADVATITRSGDSMGVAQGSLSMVVEVADCMMCIDVPPRRTLRCWDQIGAGEALPNSTVKDVGHFVMAAVCRQLLNAALSRAVAYFLSSSEVHEEQRWPHLLSYLVRIEQMFNRLCGVWLLKARLVDGNSGLICFYSILENALLNYRRQQRDVDLLVDSLVYSIHLHLLRGGLEGADGRRGKREIATPAAVLQAIAVPLRSRDELCSALRLARSVSSKDRFLRLYKELLAYRLLSHVGGEQRGSGVGVSDTWLQKLHEEKFICEYLQELIPCERDVILQMIRMCNDMEVNNNLQEEYQQEQEQQQCSTGNAVKLTVRLLSRLVWPRYPTLVEVSRPLQDVMEHFAAFYHARHCNRRIVWLRTSLEKITFTVTYPRGRKMIVGSMELFTIFQHLSEMGDEGITWAHLAQHVGKEKALLQRELRKFIGDGFLTVSCTGSSEERVCLNTAFASRQPFYRFLLQQQRPRLATLSEEHERISVEISQSRIASTQAAIIKQMKSVRTCLFDELFRLTQQSIRQFQLQSGDFKVALERLIEKEYVVRDQMQKQRLVYKS